MAKWNIFFIGWVVSGMVIALAFSLIKERGRFDAWQGEVAEALELHFNVKQEICWLLIRKYCKFHTLLYATADLTPEVTACKLFYNKKMDWKASDFNCNHAPSYLDFAPAVESIQEPSFS